MPIGKISKSGERFTRAAEYDLAQGRYRTENSKKKPVILKQNMILSKEFRQIGFDFHVVAEKNKRCKKPVLKFSVSFDPKEELTDDEKIEFTSLVMQEMGISDFNHQYIVTRHQDKAHDHHHVLANRVGVDRKVIGDSFSQNRMEVACDKVEKMLGMKNDLAKKRRFVYDETVEKGYLVQQDSFSKNKEKTPTKTTKKNVENKKKLMQNEIDLALIHAQNLNQFFLFLMEKKIEAKFRLDRKSMLTGISFRYDHLSVKGSAFGTKYKASNIEKTIALNQNNPAQDNQIHKGSLQHTHFNVGSKT